MKKDSAETRTVKVSSLTPDKRNANKGTQRGMGMLEDSLHEYGAGRSILLDKHGNVLAGNKTLETAAQIGMEDVLVIPSDGTRLVAVQRTDLDIEEERAIKLALADNRIGEVNLDWSPEQVRAFLDEGMDISDLWTDEELAALIAAAGSEFEGNTDPDHIPEHVETRAKAGDIWQLGKHRLLCGDCTIKSNVDSLFQGGKADCVLTDPPYGINRTGVTNDDPEMLQELYYGVLKCLPVEDAIVVAFQSPRMFPAWLDAIRETGHSFQRMLWMQKENDVTYPWRGWLMTSEAILISEVGSPVWPKKTPKPFSHDCYRVQWDADNKDTPAGWHGSIKPFTVVKDIASRLPGLIYDPFLGSGTTLMAAEHLGRTCYGMEIEPSYCDIIITRWEEYTQQTAVLQKQY